MYRFFLTIIALSFACVGCFHEELESPGFVTIDTFAPDAFDGTSVAEAQPVISPDPIAFFDVFEGQRGERWVRVSNEGGAPLVIDDLTLLGSADFSPAPGFGRRDDRGIWHVTIPSGPVEPGAFFDVKIVYAPQDTGEDAGDLLLEYRLDGQPRRLSAAIATFFTTEPPPDPCPAEPTWDGSCPARCTGGCEAGVCVIACADTSACQIDRITCPEGMACRIECAGRSSCQGASIQCPERGSCALECVETSTCQGATLICGDGPCTATCSGSAASLGSFRAGTSCAASNGCAP